MNRLLIRRCSMSSIEEEDESAASDDAVAEVERIRSSPFPSSTSSHEELYRSSSVLEWDSELSESEGEEGDHHSNDDDEDQAANRVLQSFMQSSTRTHLNPMANETSRNSPFAIHLYEEEDDPPELNAILSELRHFNAEFDETQQQRSSKKIEPSTMNYYPSSAKSPPSLSTSSCVYELRTLEDQLEAALASLTLTINDCTAAQTDLQPAQRSSDSSACSSGLGDEIGTEPFQLYGTVNISHPNASFSSKCAHGNTDDCDSAFSDSGSTGKVVPPHHDESVIYRSIVPVADPLKETSSIVHDPADSVSSYSQHPSKILVRTYNDDGSTKSIFVDDSMLIRDVLLVLVHKNHREPDVNHALIEILPDLHMERIFEDHQKLMEAILMWPTVSSNRLSFTRRLEKYHFFRTLPTTDDLLHSPDIEGNVYLKEKSRKSWKKHFCVLRSSGLYFVPKGKTKKDLVCLAKFENVELFFGLEWKRKFKSPSDFCFALKHPLIQKKSSKYIKYMCVETQAEFDRWITNIRIAKFGQQLKVNYSFMEQAMGTYRLTGRFAAMCPIRSETPNEQQHEHIEAPLPDRRTPIPNNHYYAIHSTAATANDAEDEDEQKSPIKSASYMDELRQRLERVLNESSPQRASPVQPLLHIKEPIRRPTLLPPPPPPSKLKPTKLLCLDSTSEGLSQKTNAIKSPVITASTPLPRKQIKPHGNLSYRTMDASNYQSQQSMSKSFSISTKREEHQSASSLSTTSKSESIGLDETDFSLPSSTFLTHFNKSNAITTTVKSKPMVINIGNANRSKQPATLKKPLVSFRSYAHPSKNGLATPSTSDSQLSKQSKPPQSSIPCSALNKNKVTPAAATNKSVPPVPPRRSSIPRPALTPQLPQRGVSTALSLRKPQISHL